ncbi:pseudouridine synthase [Leptolyngbya sp. FACHB-16]|uniref:pseudouridine synthase n=1 Tax=unclassified Leptolyngbya TaxID=2650499 RepID=UPI001687D84C|nr:pseudouridine synthase [Leptolyngbya sp. FACHB-16]MBD2154741.1 RluA family pseudouridine synthase [Leptolyngbya sp. FACHB-16]
MVEFQTLLRWEHDGERVSSHSSYWYEGRCPYRGTLLRLPRTALVEAIAHELMQQLADDPRYSREGKMYGVLLVETPTGLQVLKAFSGLLNGESQVAGWLPPIPGREHVAQEEARTLSQLETIKQHLLTLQHLPERQQYAGLVEEFATQLQQLSQQQHPRKLERQQQRQIALDTLDGEALAIALNHLDDQSRRDGIERRNLKRQRDEALRSLKLTIEAADARIRELKHERKALSQQLQAQMHAVYRLTNFAGQSLTLQDVITHGAIPTGTGDCCAPKLLHYAAIQGYKPLSMAEFWWGPSTSNGDKVQGEFYGACAERCQPLMGFLLSGLSGKGSFMAAITGEKSRDANQSLHTIYTDEWLIAINKPAGLLSVPGRSSDRQDSVLSRLQLCEGMGLIPVHRLDQDTSGILLLARDLDTYRHLSRQFQQRQVHKVYEALLVGRPEAEKNVIELPLWADPSDRPYQKVDVERGKPSVTHVQIIRQDATTTRVEFIPLTGRTHQLRVHAAHPEGLGAPILGDRLYGTSSLDKRLHLHARELRFQHPHSGKWIHLKTETPF